MFEHRRYRYDYGYGPGYGGYCSGHLSHNDIHFPGLTKTEIRQRKNEAALDRVVNKTGRRSGQKVKRFGRS